MIAARLPICCGFLARGGDVPASAVPLQLWQEKLGLDVPEDAAVSEQADRPHYWTGQQVTCAAPMQIDLMGTQGDLAGLTGLV